MTERYWQRYRNAYYADPLNSDPFWVNVKNDVNRKRNPKHHLELYSICRSPNPYINQIKSSPNITHDTVAELICRDKACELQYCMSLQLVAAENRRRKIDLQGCESQQKIMNSCITQELQRIQSVEQKLRERTLGIENMDQKPIFITTKKNSQETMLIEA
ncbi:hypothetical protein TTHERM_00138200 (macronuclear) [Tetrahymena thermophila SB210]|uniref:Uncharacterized protein n=1 Tax=Tetrahymena thermophila (strain SB210) TaxID=312017 RepID=I7MFA6_TETTS|nr:hypothetical protein TTHERM_00138200 [Tetrahymena thermophila SB210]EAR99557.2 hypothetical protein TTHERM_00138200 [Tetrahymena thermophila SB210]|eukprot:XP_001019802.2 hypothetical protein TTHERM_00138200 [Tetrahymena thermophila SB210]